MNNWMRIVGVVALFCWGIVLAQAQTNNLPYGMGLPEGPDETYEELPVKPRLTGMTYRSVGRRASLEKYAPSPKSQGLYGTCTGWAAGYAARTILEAQRYGWTDRTTINANAFSHGFAYRISSEKNDCNGAYISKCLQKMRDVGIVKLDRYPEDCPTEDISRPLTQEASAYKIKGYATLWNTANPATPKERVQALKMSINQGHPVIIAMFIPQSFCYNKGAVWNKADADKANARQGHKHNRHAMCLIGYDDDVAGGAFRIMNSWGSRWADQGFIWVKYSDAAEFIYQAVELYKLPKIKKEAPNAVMQLAGSIKMVETTGQEMKATWTPSGYKLNKAYRSGTRFRLYLNNRSSAYVYAIGSDLSHQVYTVFPYAPGISPLLNYSVSSVPIPNETQHIRLDGKTGTDYLCVLYSKERLDIEAIKRGIAKQSNHYSFQEKVRRVLGERIMAPEAIQYQKKDGRIAFTASSKTRPVVALFVQWAHIE